MYLLIIIAIVVVVVVIKHRKESKRSKNTSTKNVEYEVHVEIEKEPPVSLSDTNYENGDDENIFPQGWFYQNKDFIDKISTEYSYFLENWVDSKQKDVRTQYGALKSFVIYLQDIEKLCKSKGELFYTWFTEILTTPSYLDMRKEELRIFQSELNQRLVDEKEYNEAMDGIDEKLIQIINDSPGILQKDLYALFTPLVKKEIQSTLYQLDKNSLIQREKVGNTYKLTAKNN